MKKITHGLVVLFTSIALIFVSFAPASALSIENHRTWYGSQQKCYYNYNWWETYVQGKQDTWKYGNQWC